MNRAFEVHMLNEAGKARARLIAEAFDHLVRSLSDSAFNANADARLQAIVMTKLEEACFFAKKAMASMVENQETPK